MSSRPIFSWETTGHPKWKYRLTRRYECLISLRGRDVLLLPWAVLQDDGTLTIAKGYCWDGASGPAIDTPDFLRASLVHDVLYQFLREDKLPLSDRKSVDHVMREIATADFMPWWRAAYTYHAVRAFAYIYARPWGPKG